MISLPSMPEAGVHHGSLYVPVSESDDRSHGSLPADGSRPRLPGQGLHKGFQTFSILSAQIYLEGLRQAAFQAQLPALAAIVQISPPSGVFAGGVNQHTIRRPHEAEHLPLG